MRLYRIPAAAAIAFALFANDARALDPTTPVTRLRIRIRDGVSGMPQNSARAIAQTADGYLWIGTEEGLARFDGTGFTTYDRTNAPSFVSPNIRAMVADQAGAIWMATFSGVVRMREGRFTHFGKKQGLPAESISSLAVTRGGDILAGTRGGGLARISPDGKITTIDLKMHTTTNSVNVVLEDPDGTIWFGTPTDGVGRRAADGTVTMFLEAGTSISSLCRDGRDLWIGAANGLTRYDGSSFHTYPASQGAPTARVNSIKRDRAGTLWLGTIVGMVRYRDGQFSTYTTAHGLPDATISSILEDQRGNLWVGTLRGGLVQFSDATFTVIDSREGLTEKVVMSVVEDDRGTLWIGHHQGLASMRDGVVKAYGEADGIPRTYVHALASDEQGGVWAGTPIGLFHVTAKGTRQFTIGDGLASNHIGAIVISGGELWVATREGSLHRHTPRGTFERFLLPDAESIFTSLILRARDGSLLMSNGSSISKIANGAVSAVVPRSAIGHWTIAAIAEDPDGTIWVATLGGGLIRWQNGRASVFTTKQGLVNDHLMGVVADSHGNLWLPSNAGISRFTKTELGRVAAGLAARAAGDHYGIADGLRSREFNQGFPGNWTTRDGKLLLATMAGIAVVDPSRLRNRAAPLVAMGNIRAGDRLLARNVSQLAAGTKRIEFAFSTIDFEAPEEVRFSYRLEGFDHHWHEAGASRSAVYAGLPPGTYRFRVRACNARGGCGAEGVSAAMTMQPHFYQTTPFQTLTGLSMLFVPFGIFRLRIRTLKKKERVLVKLVEERTMLLRQSNEQLAVANENLRALSMNDALTGIANRRAFDEFLRRESAQAARAGTPLTIALLDVDHFKAYNDHYGHQEGDRCLQAVAEALRAVTRSGDLVARYGGEEFAVIMAGTNARGGIAAANTLRRAVENAAIAHGFSSAADRVTVSIGVATAIPASADRGAALIVEADRALYVSKDRGRNRVTHAEGEPLRVAA